MSFLPELLALHKALTSIRTSTPQQVDSTVNHDINKEVGSFRLQMRTVGCTACLTTVHGVLRQENRISSYETNLDKGVLTIYYKRSGHDDSEGESISKDVLESLAHAGFPMTLESSSLQSQRHKILLTRRDVPAAKRGTSMGRRVTNTT